MNKWEIALKRAFHAHLQNAGSRGSTGSGSRNFKGSNTLRRMSAGTPTGNSRVPGVPAWGQEPMEPLPEFKGFSGLFVEDCRNISNLRPAEPVEPLEPQRSSTPAAVLREWEAGVLRLQDGEPPAGFTHEAWTQMIADGRAFLGEWGERAAHLGWTSLDLFGVHPLASTARYDVMGLVPLIRSDEVVALGERSATTQARNGSLLTYVRRPMKGAVLLWELGTLSR